MANEGHGSGAAAGAGSDGSSPRDQWDIDNQAMRDALEALADYVLDDTVDWSTETDHDLQRVLGTYIVEVLKFMGNHVSDRRMGKAFFPGFPDREYIEGFDKFLSILSVAAHRDYDSTRTDINRVVDAAHAALAHSLAYFWLDQHVPLPRLGRGQAYVANSSGWIQSVDVRPVTNAIASEAGKSDAQYGAALLRTLCFVESMWNVLGRDNKLEMQSLLFGHFRALLRCKDGVPGIPRTKANAALLAQKEIANRLVNSLGSMFYRSGFGTSLAYELYKFPSMQEALHKQFFQASGDDWIVPNTTSRFLRLAFRCHDDALMYRVMIPMLNAAEEGVLGLSAGDTAFRLEQLFLLPQDKVDAISPEAGVLAQVARLLSARLAALDPGSADHDAVYGYLKAVVQANSVDAVKKLFYASGVMTGLEAPQQEVSEDRGAAASAVAGLRRFARSVSKQMFKEEDSCRVQVLGVLGEYDLLQADKQRAAERESQGASGKAAGVVDTKAAADELVADGGAAAGVGAGGAVAVDADADTVAGTVADGGPAQSGLDEEMDGGVACVRDDGGVDPPENASDDEPGAPFAPPRSGEGMGAAAAAGGLYRHAPAGPVSGVGAQDEPDVPPEHGSSHRQIGPTG